MLVKTTFLFLISTTFFRKVTYYFSTSVLDFNQLIVGIAQSVSFDVVNSGVGTLDLSSVVLSDSLGREITPVSLSDGNISAVPVPSAMLLMATGLSVLGLRKTKATHA